LKKKQGRGEGKKRGVL